MNRHKISVALIMSALMYFGCSTVEREMLSIDSKTYESLTVSAASESDHHKVIVKFLKEVSNQNAPVECEFIIEDFIGDPGICKQATLVIDNANYGVKVMDSKSGTSMEGVPLNRQKYRQKPESFDYDIKYQIYGKFTIASDVRKKIKNGGSLAVKFQTYNRTIDLLFDKKIATELKNYL